MSNAEYLPETKEAEPQERTNDTKDKVTKDKVTKIILRARLDALTNPHLTLGARTLFTLLLDMSLNPFLNLGRTGEVVISAIALASRLGSCKRSVYAWKQELEDLRFIWVSKKPRPNMEPMNVYHIMALQPVREMSLEVPLDGMWGNGKRRPQGTMPQGARAKNKMHTLVDQFGRPLFSQIVDNEPAKSINGHLGGANFAGGECKKCPGEEQILREPGADFAPGTRKKVTLPPAKFAPPPETKPTPLRESLDRDRDSRDPDQGGEGRSPAPDKQGKAIKEEDSWMVWRKKLTEMYPSGLEKLRKEFAGQIKAVKSLPGNWDLVNSPLAPKTQEYLTYVDQQIEKLANGGAKGIIESRKRQRADYLADPKSYSELKLVPAALDQVALLTRKIAMVDEVLKGPAA